MKEEDKKNAGIGCLIFLGVCVVIGLCNNSDDPSGAELAEVRREAQKVKDDFKRRQELAKKSTAVMNGPAEPVAAVPEPTLKNGLGIKRRFLQRKIKKAGFRGCSSSPLNTGEQRFMCEKKDSGNIIASVEMIGPENNLSSVTILFAGGIPTSIISAIAVMLMLDKYVGPNFEGSVWIPKSADEKSEIINGVRIHFQRMPAMGMGLYSLSTRKK